MRAAAPAISPVSCTTSVRPPLSPVISRSVSALSLALIAWRSVDVDRDRIHERFAPQQRRSHIAQRRVAGGVGTVGDDQQGRALACPLLEHRQCASHRVVHGRAAGRMQAVQRPTDDVWRVRPVGEHVRLVIERQNEELVRRVEQLQ